MTITTSIEILHDRAASLRTSASTVNPLVAQAYLRRAAELDLVAAIGEAWVTDRDTIDPRPRGRLHAA